MNSSSENSMGNRSPSLVRTPPVSISALGVERSLLNKVKFPKPNKNKNSTSKLADRQQVASQQLHELTSGPSTLPVQTLHQSAKSHSPLQCPSLAIDGKLAHNPMPAGLPAARGGLNDTRTTESTATSTAPPEAPTSPETDQLQDVFREPLRIPGHKEKMYVYKHADARISDAHKERYPKIIDLFRQKLLTVRALSKLGPANTLYKMKMCGPDPKNAQPSILIFHWWIDKDVSRHIWKSLRKKSLRKQYEDIQPAFRIYIFFSRDFWMLGNSMRSLSICMEDSLFIGARLVSNDTSYQVSTITCGISFAGDNTIFALTSAHAFEDDDSKINDKLLSSHNDSTTEPDSLESDDTSDHSFPSKDDEYNWDELEAAAAIERQGASLGNPNEPAPLKHEGKEGNTSHCEIKPSRVWGRPKDPKWESLDWALVEILSLDQRNLFGRPSYEGSFVKPSCPSKAVGTVVVATASGLLEGTLSSIPSYLASSRNSASLTKIWTLTLAYHHQGRLHKGDSGSPVLNLDRNLVYGYVTALNPFGELHVIPLQAVLNQIWQTVQPINPSLKPIIFDRIGAGNSSDNNSTTSTERWPTGRLLQHWPEELAEVPDSKSTGFTASHPNDASNNTPILEAVLGRLKDEDRAVRAAAVKALSEQSPLPDDILKAVTGRLEDKHWSIRTAAVEALGKQSPLPDDILNAVAGRFEDEDQCVRRAAVEVLGQQLPLPDDILKAVTGRLEDKDWPIRRAAVEALGKQLPLLDDILKAVAGRLNDEHQSVRGAAVEALGKQSPLPDDILKAVVGRLEDEHKSIRGAAVEALGKQSPLPHDILKAVAGRLEHKDQPVRRRAIEALGKQLPLPDDILKAVARRLEHKDWRIRRAAIEALGQQSSLLDDILKAVTGRLEDEDWCVRRTAIEALGKQLLLSDDILKAVVGRLEDEYQSVQGAAVEALGKQSPLPDDILKAVVGRLEHKDQPIRRTAIEVLGKQSPLPDDILKAVTGRLEDEDEDQSIRIEAIEVLGKQSPLPDNILKAVAGRLKDEDQSIRRAAIEVLGKQSPLPDDILRAVAGRLEDEDEDQSILMAAIEVLGKQSLLPDNISKVVQHN